MSVEEIVKNSTEKAEGKMIVFISSKGGVGKTITSVNTAVVLADRGFSACILDGNFQFGDVNLALDIQPAFTISDLIQKNPNIENVNISYYLDVHSSGVDILSAPVKPEYGGLITCPIIKTICRKILKQYDFLIVDLPSGLSENNLAFMEMADKILLVSDAGFSSLKNTKIMLRTLSIHNMINKVRVIVNRYDEQSSITVKAMLNMLEVEDISFIRSNPKLVSKSFDIGVPFVISTPRARTSKDIIDLAGEICKLKD